MLVLTRKAQEKIQIGDKITVTIVRIKGQAVRVGIDAPENIRIMRGELAAAAAEFRDSTDSNFEAVDSEELPRSEFHDQELANEDLAGDAAETEDETCACPRPVPQPPSRTQSACRASVVRHPPRLGPASLRRLNCR
jgi:carbon storage regulator CsrA